MIFVLDTAIGFGVWLPFTFGKTTALLSVRGTEISDWT
jgi:E3 ubiquitin-protein ligase MARCH6